MTFIDKSDLKVVLNSSRDISSVVIEVLETCKYDLKSRSVFWIFDARSLPIETKKSLNLSAILCLSEICSSLCLMSFGNWFVTVFTLPIISFMVFHVFLALPLTFAKVFLYFLYLTHFCDFCFLRNFYRVSAYV